MVQQTTVEWLENNLIGNPHFEEDFRHNRKIFEQAKQMEKEQLKQEFIQGYNLGYEDSQCNHINDGETLAQEREYLKESTCEYSGLRSVQSYEDPKK